MLDCFLVSPYHTGSHAAWAQGYIDRSTFQIDLISMAGRFWKWRMQGGALELSQQVIHHCQFSKVERQISQDKRAERYRQPDCLWVTDMTNLPALLALARPYLDGVPILYYAHENQLTYPTPPGEKRDLTYAAINLLSMVTADAIAFNSHYHLQEFFDELPRLLKHFPDYNHLDAIPKLQAKSQVLPVGLDLHKFDPYEKTPFTQKGSLRILWNQRWEYDKNPSEFFQALYELDKAGVPFEVVVAGENFRQQPAEFAEARRRLGDRIVHFGYADTLTSYAQLLFNCDVVVSTAHHEFFGISVLEAMYCHCYPLLPNRLSYPELIPQSLQPEHLYDTFEQLCDRLKWAAHHLNRVRESSLRSVALEYEWHTLAPRYDAVTVELIQSSRKGKSIQSQRDTSQRQWKRTSCRPQGDAELQHRGTGEMLQG
ncbi:MAG: DUF3524 domain-containing protein [Synechococcus sp.]